MVFRPFTSGRRLLLAGFGGLLVLMLAAGVDALFALHEVRARDAQVRDVYFRRSRALDEVRAGIYQSAIVMRDYLLASDRQVAQAQVDRWTSIRRNTDRALADCASALDPAEAGPFLNLQSEVQTYWKLLDFVVEMQGRDKRSRGAAYFSQELVRRRDAMLTLVDRIDQISTRQLSSSDAKLNETFDGMRRRLIAMLGVTLGVGLLLAAFTIRRTLNLENELSKRYEEGVAAQR